MPLPTLRAVEGHPGIATDPKGRYWVRVKLGTRPFRELRNSLKDAIHRRDALKVEYRQKRALPGHRDFKNPGKIKLADYLERYWKKHEISLRPATVKRYKVSEKALLGLMGKNIYLTQITSRVVDDFRARRRREVEPASVNRDLTRLQTILKEAVREGFLQKLPFEYRREKLREPEGRLRFLSEEEEDALMFYSEPLLMVMVQFALLTGFRLNEQLRLTWNDVHRAYIHLPGSKTKTHRRRVVPLTDKIRDILEEQKGKHPKWVFPNRTRTNCWDTQNFYRSLWNPTRDRAGIVDLRWHDLRHTFCSRLVAKGANIVAVKELAGHRSVEVTMRYVHLTPDHLRSTMNLL